MADLIDDEQVVRHVKVEADRVAYSVSYTMQMKQFHPLVTFMSLESSVRDDETAEEAVKRIRESVDPLFLQALRENVEEVTEVISGG